MVNDKAITEFIKTLTDCQVYLVVIQDAVSRRLGVNLETVDWANVAHAQKLGRDLKEIAERIAQ